MTVYGGGGLDRIQHEFRIGSRLASGSGVSFGIEGARAAQAASKPGHRLRLDGRFSW